MENLKTFKSWVKQNLVTLRKGDQVVYLVLEWNQFYGELITRFQIGDKPHKTSVLINPKYDIKPVFLDCAAHNGLIGERPFENGSLTWEFLWKPLGLEKPEQKGNPACCPRYTAYHDFFAVAEKAGWERDRA